MTVVYPLRCIDAPSAIARCTIALVDCARAVRLCKRCFAQHVCPHTPLSAPRERARMPQRNGRTFLVERRHPGLYRVWFRHFDGVETDPEGPAHGRLTKQLVKDHGNGHWIFSDVENIIAVVICQKMVLSQLNGAQELATSASP